MTWVHVHRMLQRFLDIFSYSLIAFLKKIPGSSFLSGQGLVTVLSRVGVGSSFRLLPSRTSQGCISTAFWQLQWVLLVKTSFLFFTQSILDKCTFVFHVPLFPHAWGTVSVGRQNTPGLLVDCGPVRASKGPPRLLRALLGMLRLEEKRPHIYN